MNQKAPMPLAKCKWVKLHKMPSTKLSQVAHSTFKVDSSTIACARVLVGSAYQPSWDNQRVCRTRSRDRIHKELHTKHLAQRKGCGGFDTGDVPHIRKRKVMLASLEVLNPSEDQTVGLKFLLNLCHLGFVSGWVCFCLCFWVPKIPHYSILCLLQDRVQMVLGMERGGRTNRQTHGTETGERKPRSR